MSETTRTLHPGPPPPEPDENTTYVWTRPGEAGNVDLMAQQGTGEPVMLEWLGAADGSLHVARVDPYKTGVLTLPIDIVYGEPRVRVWYDGTGPV